ncbi:MAG: tetratricopeptide repeat protein [Bacteroidota bacterium]|jgi:tetratricopeptide (TPR) repeat protein
MDAVTYPNKVVTEFISRFMIPVKVRYDHKPLSVDFKVRWTPTLIVLDKEGAEHHRTLGFLRPGALIPSLMLGVGKTHLDLGEPKQAVSKFDELLAKYPKSDWAAEAVYFRGVALYKSTNDPKRLKEAYERLSAEYPNSEWAERAEPYRLLK